MLDKETRTLLKDEQQNHYEVEFKLGGYAIIKLYANQIEANNYGDIFSSKKELKKAYPKQNSLEGYGIVDLTTGEIPVGCLDWYFLYEEAKEDLLNKILHNFHLVGNYVFEFNYSKDIIRRFLEDRTLHIDVEQVTLGYFYHISTGNDRKHRLSLSAVLNENLGYDLFFEGPMDRELRKIDESINDFNLLFNISEAKYTDMYF